MTEDHEDEINEAARQASVTLEELAASLDRPINDIGDLKRQVIELGQYQLQILQIINKNSDAIAKASSAVTLTARAVAGLAERVAELETRSGG